MPRFDINVNLLDKFASAIAKLPDLAFTRDEIRALIDRDILTIPTTNNDQIQSDARAGSGAENDKQPQAAQENSADATAPVLDTSWKEGTSAASAYMHAPYGPTILRALAEIDDLLQQMWAMQPDSQFRQALAQAQLLQDNTRGAHWDPIAQPATHPQIILQRLQHLETLMRDLTA